MDTLLSAKVLRQVSIRHWNSHTEDVQYLEQDLQMIGNNIELVLTIKHYVQVSKYWSLMNIKQFSSQRNNK